MYRLLLINLFFLASIAKPQVAVHVIFGPNLPAHCSPLTGDVWFKTTGGAGVSGLYSCDTTNTWVYHGNGGGNVSSFNSRTGAVSLLSADVTAALGFTPLSNPFNSSNLGDMNVVATSSTILTIGSNCTSSFPCRIRFSPTNVCSITGPATGTITSGSTSTAYIYETSNCVLNLGSDSGVAVTCSGCTSNQSTTIFPFGSVPVATWSVSGGHWTTGTVEYTPYSVTSSGSSSVGSANALNSSDGSGGWQDSGCTANTSLNCPGTVSTNNFFQTPIGLIGVNSSPNLSGCSISSTSGSRFVGSFISGTTGTCTVVITLNSISLGWVCMANNLTTQSGITQIAYTAGSATISGTTVTGDRIAYACMAF